MYRVHKKNIWSVGVFIRPLSPLTPLYTDNYNDNIINKELHVQCVQITPISLRAITSDGQCGLKEDNDGRSMMGFFRLLRDII